MVSVSGPLIFDNSISRKPASKSGARWRVPRSFVIHLEPPKYPKPWTIHPVFLRIKRQLQDFKSRANTGVNKDQERLN